MATQALALEIITELSLGLPGGFPSKNDKKRVFSEVEVNDENSSNNDADKNQSKVQIVGWPPVCCYRKKSNASSDKLNSSKLYVKVGMDGTPFLRKIDLKTHKDYSDLIFAFQKLFGCVCNGSSMLKDTEGSEYIPIYEDKDGDWMLVGDVPWEMFTDSCKRLRIMKRSDAKGVQLSSRISGKKCNEL